MAKANPVVSGTNVTQMARAVVSITKDEVFNWINGLDNVELSTVQEFVNVEANGRRESRLSALREEAERLGVKLAERKARWRPRDNGYGSGTLWRYARNVGPAHAGAVTHPGAKAESHVYADI